MRPVAFLGMVCGLICTTLPQPRHPERSLMIFVLIVTAINTFTQNFQFISAKPLLYTILTLSRRDSFGVGRDAQRAERVLITVCLHTGLSFLSSRTGLVLSLQLERTKEPSSIPLVPFAPSARIKKQLALYFCWKCFIHRIMELRTQNRFAMRLGSAL